MAQRATHRLRTRAWTRTDLERLPDDGNRYEVLDGALLVTPQAAFSHQEIATRLRTLFDQQALEAGTHAPVAEAP